MCLTLFNAQNVSLCLLLMFVHFCVNHWGNWLSGCLSAPASTSSLLEGKHLDISAWPYSCPARVRLYSYSASLCGQLCVRVCVYTSSSDRQGGASWTVILESVLPSGDCQVVRKNRFVPAQDVSLHVYICCYFPLWVRTSCWQRCTQRTWTGK